MCERLAVVVTYLERLAVLVTYLACLYPTPGVLRTSSSITGWQFAI